MGKLSPVLGSGFGVAGLKKKIDNLTVNNNALTQALKTSHRTIYHQDKIISNLEKKLHSHIPEVIRSKLETVVQNLKQVVELVEETCTTLRNDTMSSNVDRTISAETLAASIENNPLCIKIHKKKAKHKKKRLEKSKSPADISKSKKIKKRKKAKKTTPIVVSTFGNNDFNFDSPNLSTANEPMVSSPRAKRLRFSGNNCEQQPSPAEEIIFNIKQEVEDCPSFLQPASPSPKVSKSNRSKKKTSKPKPKTVSPKVSQSMAVNGITKKLATPLKSILKQSTPTPKARTRVTRFNSKVMKENSVVYNDMDCADLVGQNNKDREINDGGTFESWFRKIKSGDHLDFSVQPKVILKDIFSKDSDTLPILKSLLIGDRIVNCQHTESQNIENCDITTKEPSTNGEDFTHSNGQIDALDECLPSPLMSNENGINKLEVPPDVEPNLNAVVDNLCCNNHVEEGAIVFVQVN